MFGLSIRDMSALRGLYVDDSRDQYISNAMELQSRLKEV